MFSSSPEDLVAGLEDPEPWPERINPNMSATYLHDIATSTTRLLTHRWDNVDQYANGQTLRYQVASDASSMLLLGTSADQVEGFGGLASGGPGCNRFSGSCMLTYYDVATQRATLLDAGFFRDTVGFSQAQMTPDGQSVFLTKSGPEIIPGQQGAANHDLFIWRSNDDSLELLSGRNGSATEPIGASPESLDISADGRFVVLSTLSDELTSAVADDNELRDIYVKSIETGDVELISHVAGNRAQAASGRRALISADGHRVAFESEQPNSQYVEGQVDQNDGLEDIILYDRELGEARLVSHTASDDRTTAQSGSILKALSGDGRFVAYASDAWDLVAGLTYDNGFSRSLYLYDAESRSSRLVSYPAGATRVAVAGEFVHMTPDGNSLLWRGFPDRRLFRFDRVSGAQYPLLPADHPNSGVSISDAESAGSQLMVAIADPHLHPGDFNETSDIFLGDQRVCTGDDACLRSQRYGITVHWKDPISGDRGIGHPIPLTNDTIAFWFFDEANVEIVLKVLDACDSFGRSWVFAAGLTDVAVEITVTDRLSGLVQRYRNESGGDFTPILDTGAFGACNLDFRNASSQGDLISALRTLPDTVVSGGEVPPGCAPSPTTLCLQGDRFRVDAHWETVEGGTDIARTSVLTSDTGFLWFFEPDNLEAVIKVLDGCSVNGHYWLFAGGLTDVGVELTVTDTATGAINLYASVVGSPFQAVRDTAAFPCSI